jgi:threonyl-tRNA synthetase
LHGLLRVRGFTQDDAHIFCTPEGIEEEIRYTLQFALDMLRAFGMTDFKAFLSTRPEKAVGEESRWDQASNSLENALQAEKVPYEVDEGGGAFYGPKIDLKIRDALGREWQMGTIQFDFNIPERFDLTYVGSDGKEHRPYMVHRALLGAMERFFGILVEHYGGAFPLWLAPEQVRVLPLTGNQVDYARSVCNELKNEDLRAVLDEKSDKIGAKIRNARLDKVPYMIILGPKEQEKGQLSVRSRENGDEGAVSMQQLLERLKRENLPREGT